MPSSYNGRGGISCFVPSAGSEPDSELAYSEGGVVVLP